MNGNDSDAVIAEEISRVWNARHLQSLGERSVGYGGQIKTGHIKKVLKTFGQEIQQAKLGITPRRHAVEVARVLKIRQGKTLEQQKGDLQKKYEQMTEDCELSIDV